MTKEKITEVLTLYESELAKRGVDDPTRITDHGVLTRIAMERHLAWMCGEARKFVEADRIEKAMRWLGFVQGAMWTMGLRSIEEMRLDNS